MKSLLRPSLFLSVFGFLCLYSSPVSAQFATGNLVVLNVGDVDPLGDFTAKAVLKQFNTSSLNQTASHTFDLTANTTTGNSNEFFLTGNSVSEGSLTFNYHHSTLALAGYLAAPGDSTASASSGIANRITLNVNLAGSGGNGLVSQTNTTNTNFSNSSINGAVTSAGTTWAVGGNTGVVTYPGDSVVSSTVTSINKIDMFNNNLYFSSSSGSTRGIYQLGTGFPTAGGTVSTNVIDTGSTSSSRGFVINSTGTVAYIADDRDTTNGGGIQKWTFDGTSWTLAGVFTNLDGTVGAKGLAVEFVGPNPILYATTASVDANKLIKLIDTGDFAASSTVLATADANNGFRDVVIYTPTPEPTAVLALSGLGLLAFGGWRIRFRKHA
ncbi:MAG: PEP-CTERM sorting domain-containing protein [Gemmataceae bacterium]